MPESITAQVMPAPRAENEFCAASALTVAMDLLMQAETSKSGQMWKIARNFLGSICAFNDGSVAAAARFGGRPFACAMSSSTSFWIARPSSRANRYWLLGLSFSNAPPGRRRAHWRPPWLARCARSPIAAPPRARRGCSRLRSMITSKRLGPRMHDGLRRVIRRRAGRSRPGFDGLRRRAGCAKPYGPSGISGPIFCDAIPASSACMPLLQALDRLLARARELAIRRRPWLSAAGADRHVPDQPTGRFQPAGKVGVVLDGRVVLRGPPSGELPGSP